MSINIKKYLQLKKKYNRAETPEEQDELYEKMEALYFEFTDEELAYIESKEMDED